MSEETAEAQTVTRAEYDSVRNKADKSIGEAETYKRELEEYKKYGDPKTISGKLSDYELIRKEAAKTPEQIESLIKEKETEIRKGVQTELDAKDLSLNNVQKQLRELTIVDKVYSQLATDLADKTEDIVKDFIRKNCDIDDKNNLIIKDESGKARYKKDKPSELMTVEDYKQELIQERSFLFKAQTLSGGANSGKVVTGSDAGGNLTVEKWGRMSSEERQKYPLEVRAKLSKQLLG